MCRSCARGVACLQTDSVVLTVTEARTRLGDSSRNHYPLTQLCMQQNICEVVGICSTRDNGCKITRLLLHTSSVNEQIRKQTTSSNSNCVLL